MPDRIDTDHIRSLLPPPFGRTPPHWTGINMLHMLCDELDVAYRRIDATIEYMDSKPPGHFMKAALRALLTGDAIDAAELTGINIEKGN